jgi:hypothetical protein
MGWYGNFHCFKSVPNNARTAGAANAGFARVGSGCEVSEGLLSGTAESVSRDVKNIDFDIRGFSGGYPEPME